MSRASVDRVGAKVRECLVSAVDETRWTDRLCLFHHNPRFPYFVTRFTASFPIASIGGAWSDVILESKMRCQVVVCIRLHHSVGNLAI